MSFSRYIFLFLMLAVSISAVPTHRVAGDDEVKICPIHHVPLKRETLKIVYGLIPDEPSNCDRVKVAEQYFPYANSVVYGGCVVGPDSPKTKDVPYCSKCRAAEKAWSCLTTRDTPIITTLPPPRVTILPTLP